jgi:hypothetical protein
MCSSVFETILKKIFLLAVSYRFLKAPFWSTVQFRFQPKFYEFLQFNGQFDDDEQNDFLVKNR